MPKHFKSTSDVTEKSVSRVINSRRLLYFYHVANTGSLTAAEVALDVAQSALSRQIRQLETDMGTKLLERRGHGVEPTAAGAVLLDYANEVLGLMGTAVDEIDVLKLEPRDRVSLAVSRPFSSLYVPDALAMFTEEYPHIHVTVHEASSGQVYEMLSSKVVDLAVIMTRSNSPKITTVELFKEELTVVGNSGNSALQSPTVKRADLPKLNLMLPAAPWGTRRLIEQYLASGGIDIDSWLRFDSVSLMKEMIRRSTDYCALLPMSSCKAELLSGEFAASSLSPALHRTLRLAHLRDHKQPKALHALRDTLMEVVARQHS